VLESPPSCRPFLMPFSVRAETPRPMCPLRIVPRRASAMFASAVAVVTLGSTAPAFALEYPIGKPQIRAGMEVIAVYLQPVSMEPAGMMR